MSTAAGATGRDGVRTTRPFGMKMHRPGGGDARPMRMVTRELYRGLRGKVVYAEIPSIRGHGAGGAPPGTAEYAYVSDQIRAFLTGLPIM